MDVFIYLEKDASCYTFDKADNGPVIQWCDNLSVFINTSTLLISGNTELKSDVVH